MFMATGFGIGPAIEPTETNIAEIESALARLSTGKISEIIPKPVAINCQHCSTNDVKETSCFNFTNHMGGDNLSHCHFSDCFDKILPYKMSATTSFKIP